MDDRTRSIPVIFVTARFLDIDRIGKGLELGEFDYLTKPVEDEMLSAKVKVVERIIRAEAKVK